MKTKRFILMIVAAFFAAAFMAGCQTVIPPPASREKLSSPGGFKFDADDMIITFGAVEGAETYSAFINTAANPDGAPIKQFAEFTGETIELGYLEPGAYICKTRANKTAEKDASNYSNYPFIVPPPAGVELTALPTPAFIQKAGNNIVWQASVGAQSYTVKLYDKTTPTEFIFENNAVPAPPLNVSGVTFTNGKIYVIEVTANAVAGQFLKSEAGTGEFEASSLPTLAAPANVTKSGNTVSWSAVSGATNGYRLLIFNKADTNEIPVNNQNVTGGATSYDVSPAVFVPGRTYVINIYARAVYSISQESAAGVYEFTVPYPGLPAPQGLTPDVNFDTVEWQAVSGAQTYTLKVYPQGDSANLKVNDASATGTSYSISSLTFTAAVNYVFELTANAVPGAYLASSLSTVTRAAPKYRTPKTGNKTMDIGIYHAPGYDFISQNDFNNIAALGVNFIIPEQSTLNFSLDSSRAYTQLERAHIAGLQVIVHDWYIQNNLKRVAPAFNKYYAHEDYTLSNLLSYSYANNINMYKTHPAFKGVEVRDEPNAIEFDNIRDLKTLFTGTGLSVDKYFVNLYPSYAGSALGSGNSGSAESAAERQAYRKHVSDFVNTVNPPLLSYDHYPLRQGISGAPKQSISVAFFHDLEYVSRIAHQKGIPAHNILLSAAHGGLGGDYNTSNPGLLWDITEAELRWQIACAMAFGFESYTYYNYHHRDGGDINAQTLISSTTGQPNAQYYEVQQVTKEIRAWQNVYLGFNWKGTATVGTNDTGSNYTRNLFTPIDQTRSITYIGGLTNASVGGSSGTQSALIGLFEDAAANYKGFMVTNAQRPGANHTTTVTLTFDSAYDAYIVYEKGSGDDVPKAYTKDFTGGKQAVLTLQPGEGKFVIPVKLRAAIT